MTDVEKQVYDILDNLEIEYSVVHHEPLFGIDDIHKAGFHQPGLNLKNMLVREKKRDEHYLVLLKDDDRLDFKKYKPYTNWSSKMSFTEEDDLIKYLGVHAGSCSIFGLINDTEHHVVVVLDDCITKADMDEPVSFHPNINTATVTIKVRDMYKFLDWVGNKVIKIE